MTSARRVQRSLSVTVAAFLVGAAMHRSSSAPRIVVAARSWSSSATHTVRLVVVGTYLHPRVDVDAFLVLR